MIWVDYPGHFVAIALLALWALLMFLAYRSIKLENAKFWRWPLACLQFSALAVLFLILWNPSHIKKQDTTVRNTVLVFFDTSQSMSIADCEDKNRLEKAMDVFKTNFVSNSPDSPEYRIYGFDDNTYYCGSPQSLHRWGSETQLTKVLNCVNQFDKSSTEDEFGSRGKVAGAIVLTDGQAQEKEPALYENIVNPNMKIIWIGLGAPQLRSDVAITKIIAPGKSTIRTAFPVKIHLSGSRLGEEPVKIELYLDDQLINVKELPGSSILQNTPIEFLVGIDKLGSHCLTAKISGLKQEFNQANNTQQTLIDVVEPQPLKVLFYTQVANFDIGKIRQALERDKKIQLSFGLDVLVAGNNTQERKDFAGQVRLPKQKEQFFSYDVIILGPCALDQLSPEQIDGLYAFVVDRGGGLILLPGHDVFDIAISENEKIKILIPVTFNANSTAFNTRENPIHLTEEGAISNILTQNDLRTFPVQSSAYYHHIVTKPAARTLITCSSEPLVCTHRVGQGFVALINTCDLFQWYREDLQGGLLQRLISGLTSYTGRVNKLDAGIKIFAKRSPANSQNIIFEALVYDRNFQPVTDATVLLTLNNRTLRMTPADKNRYRAQVDNQPDPNFLVCVEAQQNTSFLGEKKQVINLPPSRSEMDHVELDKPFLMALAEKTSGKYLDADSVTSNITKEFQATSQVGKFSHTTSVWPCWPLLIVLCGILSLIWFTKRRLGLI